MDTPTVTDDIIFLANLKPKRLFLPQAKRIQKFAHTQQIPKTARAKSFIPSTFPNGRLDRSASAVSPSSPGCPHDHKSFSPFHLQQEPLSSTHPVQQSRKKVLMRTNSERVIHPGDFVFHSSPMHFLESLNLHRYSNANDTIKYFG